MRFSQCRVLLLDFLFCHGSGSSSSFQYSVHVKSRLKLLVLLLVCAHWFCAGLLGGGENFGDNGSGIYPLIFSTRRPLMANLERAFPADTGPKFPARIGSF